MIYLNKAQKAAAVAALILAVGVLSVSAGARAATVIEIIPTVSSVTYANPFYTQDLAVYSSDLLEASPGTSPQEATTTLIGDPLIVEMTNLSTFDLNSLTVSDTAGPQYVQLVTDGPGGIQTTNNILVSQAPTIIPVGYGVAVAEIFPQNATSLISFDSATITTVPEPATWALMVAGFAGLGSMLRRRRGELAVG